MRAGDIVKHRPSGETWTIAAVSSKLNMLSPAGWPESLAEIADCDVVQLATDEEHQEMKDACMKLPSSDIRHSWNKRAEVANP